MLNFIPKKSTLPMPFPPVKNLLTHSCPLNHPPLVTHICIEPTCSSYRLACTQCFQSPQHYYHQSKQLNSYLSQLSLSQHKANIDLNKQGIKSVQGKIWNQYKQVKKQIEGILKEIEEEINPMFNWVLKKVDEEYLRIGVGEQKVRDVFIGKQLAINLQGILEEIWSSKNRVGEANLKVVALEQEVMKWGEGMRRAGKQMWEGLKVVLQGYEKREKEKTKSKESEKQKQKQKIKKSKPYQSQPPRTSRQIEQIQKFNTLLSVMTKLQQQRSNQLSQIKTLKQQKSISSISPQPSLIAQSPFQKPLPSILQCSKQSVLSSQPISNISFFNFDYTTKGSNLQTDGKFVRRLPSLPGSCNQGLILSDLTLSRTHKSLWGIKIHKYTGWITLGIHRTNTSSLTQFKFKNSFVTKNLGHGFYGVGSTGLSYSSEDVNRNNRKIGDQFAEDGVVVRVMFDPQLERVTFRLGNEERNVCELDVKGAAEGSGAGEYRMFVFLYEKESMVELMRE